MDIGICLPCYTESKPFKGETKSGLLFTRFIKEGAIYTTFENTGKGETPAMQEVDEAMTSYKSWCRNL